MSSFTSATNLRFKISCHAENYDRPQPLIFSAHLPMYYTLNAVVNGRYRIIRLLAEGGMGVVYEAYDERLNYRVALKVALSTDKQSQQLFKDEAQRLARLRHPALPIVSDYFTENDNKCLVMDFIPGDDLWMRLEGSPQPQPVEQVVAWAEGLLDVLDYLHTRNIIHRDIKPQNIKLNSEGKPILLDFGLAKGGLPQNIISVFGYTPEFAPPEQILKQGTDARSDLYALGASLWMLLTKQLPVTAAEREKALSNDSPDPLRAAHELNPLVPKALSQTIARALMLVPSERFASAREMRAALQAPPAPQVNINLSGLAPMPSTLLLPTQQISTLI